MKIPEIRTATGEIYVRDARYENRLDTVVQHMLASGFSFAEIQRKVLYHKRMQASSGMRYTPQCL